MGAGKRKRNKHTLWASGRSQWSDRQVAAAGDQGSDRDSADVARETVVVPGLPIFLGNPYTSKRPSRLCVKFNMAERVRKYFWLSSSQCS